jgi:hypothetical protein
MVSWIHEVDRQRKLAKQEQLVEEHLAKKLKKLSGVRRPLVENIIGQIYEVKLEDKEL